MIGHYTASKLTPRRYMLLTSPNQTCQLAQYTVNLLRASLHSQEKNQMQNLATINTLQAQAFRREPEARIIHNPTTEVMRGTSQSHPTRLNRELLYSTKGDSARTVAF